VQAAQAVPHAGGTGLGSGSAPKPGGEAAYRIGPGVRIAPWERGCAGDLDVSAVGHDRRQAPGPIRGAELIVAAPQDQQGYLELQQRLLDEMVEVRTDEVHESASAGAFPFRFV
jgi:hypothetical protein